MVSYLENLSVTEAENVRKAIRALFRQTCILQTKYDPATLTPRDNLMFELCMKHRGFIEDYLSVLDCELKYDAQEHVFRIFGEGVKTERLSLTTTLIVLLVKLIYRDKILGEGLQAPITTLEEMRRYGRETNLLPDKLTAGEWKTALYLMRVHQMIDVPGEVKDVEDTTPIYLYSTINLYCSSVDINKLAEQYREDAAQLQETGEEENREAVEEDFYENADQ